MRRIWGTIFEVIFITISSHSFEKYNTRKSFLKQLEKFVPKTHLQFNSDILIYFFKRSLFLKRANREFPDGQWLGFQASTVLGLSPGPMVR